MMMTFSENSLARFSARMAAELGLHLPRERWRDLETALRAIVRQLGLPASDAGIERLLSGPFARHEIEAAASELTIGETYFFRNAHAFEQLREHVLPGIIARGGTRKRHLRIWSAGCCTGEEPYSIAILLDRYFPELRSWHVTILGTDVNPAFLRRAEQGVFGEWSFRDAPAWLKKTYFHARPDRRYELIPRIRERVVFNYLNLADDVFPSLANGTNACDLIFCRNVLMYFTPVRARAALDSFRRALIESGWLIVSPVEISAYLSSTFTPVAFGTSTFFQKSDRLIAPAVSMPNWTMEAPATSSPEPGPELTPAPHASEAAEPDHVAAGSVAETSATDRVPDAAELASRARSCANLGELAAAREWAERALAADKLDASLHHLRALILQEQGEVAGAMMGFRRALYLDPEFVLAYFALANLALQTGRRDEAVRQFSNALRLLERRAADEVLPHSEGMSAGRLKHAIESSLAKERAA